MAFSSQRSTATSGNSGANATSHSVTLPATINAGDKLYIVFVNDGDATAEATGWTEEATSANGSALRVTLLSKTAVGSEDGSIVTVTTSASESSAWVAMAWIGEHTLLIEPSGSNTGSDDSPDAPYFTPSWTAADTVWLSAAAWNGNVSHSSYPSGTSGITNSRWANGDGVGIAVSSTNQNVESYDPNSHTLGSSTEWVAFTIAIQPKTGGSIFGVNDDDTASASGTVTNIVTGSSTPTNAGDTSTASGTQTFTGTIAASAAADTSNASGTLTVTGTSAATNAADTSSAGGSVGSSPTGTIAATNAADTSSASGAMTITGTATVSSSGDASSASGTATGNNLGTISATAAGDTSTASGSLTITGSVAATLSGSTSSATGTLTVTGTATAAGASDTSTATGGNLATGTIAANNASDTSTASGIGDSPPTPGPLDTLDEGGFKILDEDGNVILDENLLTTASAYTAEAVGIDATFINTGFATRTNAADTGAASGSVSVPGAASPANANDVGSATGNVISALGSILATNADDTSTAAGTITHLIGVIAATNNGDTATAIGTVTVTITAGVAEANAVGIDADLILGDIGTITDFYTDANWTFTANRESVTLTTDRSALDDLTVKILPSEIPTPSRVSYLPNSEGTSECTCNEG